MAGTLRRLDRPKPGGIADLRAGQAVEVTGDGEAAVKVLILWPEAGTLVEVKEDSIVFRPEAAAAGPAPQDRTLSISKEETAVLFALVREMKTRTGQVVRSIAYQDAAVTDLKAGQYVKMCDKGGIAIQVEIEMKPEPKE